MGSLKSKRGARIKRKRRIRKKFSGTAERPRMSVFRSARHVYVQLIDDTKGHTIIAAASNEKDVTSKNDIGDKRAVATYVGKLAASRALEAGIKEIVFDRNGFLYHGRIKAISDGAREAGLKF
jgi:large subunit ribosomal protein L18